MSGNVQAALSCGILFLMNNSLAPQRSLIWFGVSIIALMLLPIRFGAAASAITGNSACAGVSQGLTTHHTFMTSSGQPRQFNESTDRIFRSASVPDILKITKTTDYFSKGELVMYFNRDGLCMSTSLDRGASWSSPKSVSINGGVSDSAVDPSIVQLPNGKLRLYYYGPTSTNGDPAQIPGKHSIYSAKADNGLQFTRESGKRYSVKSITDPEVVKLGDTWFMYLSNGQQSFITRSRDGLHFIDTGKTWNGGGIPGAYVHDNVVDIFGCSGNSIVSARSSNGKDFSETRPVFSNDSQPVCDPSPVKLNRTTYLLFYKKVVSQNEDSTDPTK